MKNSEKSLDRLLQTAGLYGAAGHGHAVGAEEEAPYGFATRVVAGWLAGAGTEARLQTMWYRRALVCALAVMAVSVGWSFKTDTAAPNEEMAIASYDVSADLP
jgi:hypothetical protein